MPMVRARWLTGIQNKNKIEVIKDEVEKILNQFLILNISLSLNLNLNLSLSNGCQKRNIRGAA